MTVIRDAGAADIWAKSDLRENKEIRSGRFAGEKTFGVIFQRERSFKSHSPQPEGQAKPLRGQSPRLFDAEPHPPDWRAKEVSVPSPWPSPARGEGIRAEAAKA